MTLPVRDAFARPLGSLRLSVTDRCNLRCRYCMPETDYVWLPRDSILTFEELVRITRVFTSLGVSKVRLTGGEPLLRHELPSLVQALRTVPGVGDLALTTNGVLLAPAVDALRQAGLHRVTVSLDTLRPERLAEFARSTRHEDIIAGIRAARDGGLGPVKINSVILRGFNDDEIGDLLEFARTERAELRFIEYMDVGGATRWSMDAVVSRDEILDRIAERFGRPTAVQRSGDATIAPSDDVSRAPAERYALPDGTVFGVIASVTAPFCRDCDRSRITADGTWLLCLYAAGGVDLREPLRMGATDEELQQLIREVWAGRRDRGAEARAASPGRSVLYGIASLRADPHREMHTRGG
jgi:cyclic pyranopterin phosphate synthase